MACLEKSNSDNFLRWNKVVGDLTLEQLQSSGIPSNCDNISTEVPTNFQVTVMTSCDVDISWSGDSDEYELQRSTLPLSGFVTISIQSETTYVDSNLSVDEYYYQVRALGTVPSSYTSILSADVDGTDTTETTLTATLETSCDAEIVWSYSTFDEDTEVWRSDNGGAYALLDTVNAGIGGYIDSTFSTAIDTSYKIKKTEWTCFSQEISLLTEVANTWLSNMTTPSALEVFAINKYCVNNAANVALKDYMILPSLGAVNGIIDAFGKTATPNGTITWVIGGAQFGADGYLSLDFNIATDSINGDIDNSIITLFPTVTPTGNTVMVGASDGTNYTQMRKSTTTVRGNISNISTAGHVYGATLLANSVYEFRREEGTVNQDLYKDGINTGFGNVSKDGLTNAELTLGARNNNGVVDLFSLSTIAFLSLGGGFTGSGADENTHLRQLLTDLGTI